VDQATKQLVVHGIDRNTAVDVVPGLELTNTRNTGVAFGAFAGGGAIVGVLIAVSLGLLLVYFVLNRGRPWLWLPVGLLLGGAIGNLVDRIRIGSVVDWIDPAAWPAFNVADACITIGVLGLLWLAERDGRSKRPAES
jgi:signal peptidase II